MTRRHSSRYDSAQLNLALPRCNVFRQSARSTEQALITRLLGAEAPRLREAQPAETVESLAKILCVSIERFPLNTCGQLLYDREFPVILLNTDHNWRKQRFTLAHELAHYLVLRYLDHQENTDIAALVAERGGTAKFERFIDSLAVRLLLPYDLFYNAAMKLESDGVRGFPAVWRLREMFGASLSATVRRLVDLTKDYAFLLCKRYAVPGKPPKLRIANASSRSVGFIARHKSIPPFGPIANAYETHKYAAGEMLVSGWGRDPAVLHVEAVPTHPGLKGAYVLIDLRPRTMNSSQDLVSLVLSRSGQSP